MINPNQHIEEYLDGYLEQSEASYAVLISGQWGSGKTYFLKEYIKKKTEENQDARADGFKHFCYISMNGVETSIELDRRLFFALHPKLDKKYTKLLARFTYGAVGLIPGGDAVQKLFSELNLSDFTNLASDRVLVFDDLERCQLSLKSSLGYINDFVEHSGCHVIVACDDKKVGDHDVEFSPLKEKLFGKTMMVQHDPLEMARHFIERIKSDDTKTFLRSEVALVAEIFQRSLTANLRLLKHGLMDFEEIFLRIHGIVEGTQEIPTESRTAVYKNILQQHLAFYLELGVGSIKAEEINNRINIGFKKEYRGDAESESKRHWDRVRPFVQKYEDLLGMYLRGPMLDLWAPWFEGAIFDEGVFRTSLVTGEFAANMPRWMALLSPYDLDDDEFAATVEETWKKLERQEVTESGDVLLLSDALMHLSEAGLIEDSKDEIRKKMIEYVKQMRTAQGRLLDLSVPLPSHRGWGVDPDNYSNIRPIREYLYRTMAGSIAEEGKSHEETILKWVEQEPRTFLNRFSPPVQTDPRHSAEPDVYLSGPALAKIDPELFFKSLLKAPNEAKGSVVRALSNRAKSRSVFAMELDFLKGLREKIESHIETQKGTKGRPSLVILEKTCLDELNEAIAILERREVEPPQKFEE